MKGHIRKRGDKSWAIVIDLGRDAEGKRRQKWHSVKGSKRAAEKGLTSLLNALNTGTYVEPTRLTTGEFLERWLTHARTNIAAKTYWRYRQIVRNALTPALGSIPLPQLRPLVIQEHYAESLKSGRMDGKGGLSARSVLHHHRVLRTALRQAVKWQLLIRNPADAVEPPRPKHAPVQVPSDAEVARLLDSSRGTRLLMPITLAVGTGMRRGEILAARWSDLNLVSRTLTVAQSLSETPDGLEFKEPKSSKGHRKIALPAFLVEALVAHKVQQEARQALLEDAYADSDLICSREDGTPWPPSAFTSAYRDLLKSQGIRNITFHSLRHCHASQLLKAGVSAKVISERLGHSKVGFTLDVYAHLLPGMDEDAADLLDNVVRRAQAERSDSLSTVQ